MTLNFKKCTVNDLSTLIEISRVTFIDAFEKDNNPDDFHTYIQSAFSKKTIKAELENPNSTFYLAYQDKKLTGYFKLNNNDAQNELFDVPSIELERIYVYQKYQNNGLGKLMINQAISLARESQVRFIWLGVWEKNTSAIRFYQNNGFSKFDSHPYYIGKDRQIDWLMKLSLV